MTNETITEDLYNEVDQLPAKPSVFTGRTAIWIGVSTPLMALGQYLIQDAKSSYSSESSVGMWMIVALAAVIAMLAAFWYQFKTLRNALGTLGDEGRGLAEKMKTILIMIPTVIAVTVLSAVLAPSNGSAIAIPALAGIYLGWLTYNLGSSISEEFSGRLGKLGKLIEYAGIINILWAIINPFMSFAEDESQVAIVMILTGLVLIAQFAVGIWASVVFDRLFTAYYPTAADGQPAEAMQSPSSTVNRAATANAADNRKCHIGKTIVPAWSYDTLKNLAKAAAVLAFISTGFEIGLFDMIEPKKTNILGQIIKFLPAVVWVLASAACEAVFFEGIKRSMASLPYKFTALWNIIIGSVVACGIFGALSIGDPENESIETLSDLASLAVLVAMVITGIKYCKTYSGKPATMGKIFVWTPIAGIAAMLVLAMFMPEDYGSLLESERSYRYSNYTVVTQTYKTSHIILAVIAAGLTALMTYVPCMAACNLFADPDYEAEDSDDTNDSNEACETPETTAPTASPTTPMQTEQPTVEQPVVEPPVAEPVAQTTPEPVVEKPAEAALPPEEQPVANENQAEEPQKINPKMWILIAGLLVLGIAAGWFVSRQSDSTDEDAQIVITDEEEFEEEGVAVGNYKMTGTVDAKWPVTMWLSVDENGNAKGRYCYDRTIDKYGDKAENYFYLNGYRDIDGVLYLTSNKWGENEDFERLTLKINGSVAAGVLRNTDSDNNHSVMFDNVIKAQL